MSLKTLLIDRLFWFYHFEYFFGFRIPSPDDIIDACNKALAELTDEVNDQFTNMQAYVDQAILDEESQLMNLDYQQYHDYFTGCVDEVKL